MTTVSPKKNHDPARVNEISEKLMENPELASLISELSTSADDASAVSYTHLTLPTSDLV